MAPSRGRVLIQLPSHLTYRHVIYCRRPFTCTTISSSGHNRWSKIKHDKGKNDAAKNRQRSIFAQEIATTSRMSGPDPNSNPKLADLITKAKRDGMAKTSIEAAIARGQGRSTSGANLESVTVEGILPNNVAVIVECETDNRLRTLSEVRLVMKEAGGSATPCAYLFEKRGRIVFERKEGTGLEEVLDAALEAGATDLEEDAEGSLVVFSDPGNTKAVGEAISRALGLETKTSEIIWYANEETKVNVPSVEAAEELGGFVDELSEKESSVQSVAMNIAQGSLDSQSWEELMSRLS